MKRFLCKLWTPAFGGRESVSRRRRLRSRIFIRRQNRFSRPSSFMALAISITSPRSGSGGSIAQRPSFLLITIPIGISGWVNRALELPEIEKVSVWGCGNFECWWPGRIFGNNRAERSGRLEVHPWADDRSTKDRARRGAILHTDWREKFERFADSLDGTDVYVTVDLDCLRSEEALTNWENGRFSVEDVGWAIAHLAEKNRIVGGDICGAWSPPAFARWKQRFASEMDHPKLPGRNPIIVRQTNLATLQRLLPVLTQTD